MAFHCGSFLTIFASRVSWYKLMIFNKADTGGGYVRLYKTPT